ncbi:MAG: rhamnan synthesis F family protein, partial [Gemmatimonadaceae bacterium]|nr:rhamnan synthesis F family protein [Gemmatimonadaceae bacterium]
MSAFRFFPRGPQGPAPRWPLAALALAVATLAGGLPVSTLPAQSSGQGNAAGAASVLSDTARSVRAGVDPLRGNVGALSALSAQARSQQDAFERNHRLGLRFYNGGADASCEVPLGRICYWNNNGDVPPPAERNDAKIEREQLLDLLARAQSADPKDDWVNGMRVRYAIEGQKPELAVEAARACGGTSWWCDALQGLALHNANLHREALAAFGDRLDVRVTINRGRDIAPRLVGFADVFSQHDLVLLLHSKKSLHTPSLAGWCDFLVDHLAGSQET